RPQSTGGFTQAQAEQYHQQNSLFAHQEVPTPRREFASQVPREEVVVEAPRAQPTPASQSEMSSEQQEEPREIPREMPRARERLSSRLNTATRQAARESMREAASVDTSAANDGALVSRRSVAKPEDTEFVPVKRTPKKVASQISYTTNSTRKKTKSVDPKYVTWLVKGSWVFCGIMVLRLIFAAGGVTDYYSQKSSFNERINELNDIKKDNMQLVRDIERMKTDIGFQKKLVRDNLGFIAADEFLVLFPKEK
ncbi:MAG: hypothetical protein K2Q18_18975, partial [Bdellovibrionales bacterium]|nr:hypothetical protein [Bdellovibrionales bacterium]